MSEPKQTESLLSRYAPGLADLGGYRREWLPRDLLAGITVCIVMIPAVIAYAELIGVPPQHGLYAALVPLVVYALFSTSRQVIVGPDIAISLLIASTIAPLASGDAGHAATLAAAMALLSGCLLLLGAAARFGAVADFLSKPVLVGYMTGAALILVVSQLNHFFGLHLESREFFPSLAEFSRKLGQVHLPTLAVGVGCLALLLVSRRLTPKVPAALVACLAALAASWALHLKEHGVAVIGTFPTGFPSLKVPTVSWDELRTLLPASVGVALLTYTEGILLARAFAAKNGYEVNANKELIALGLADVGAGLFKGFSITGSQARTTVNDSAGGKTQLSSLVAALSLAAFLLFLTPAIAQLPQAALAALLIYAGFYLVEFDVMLRIYRYYRGSAVVAALTTLCVLVAGVVPGIIFGVTLSLLGLINRISHPPDAVLVEVPGQGFHDLGNTNATQTVPGLLAYRFYAPLLFSNAGHFVERVRHLVQTSDQPLRTLLLDAQAITDIDVTAVEALHGLNQELRQQGITLKIAHANLPLRQLLERTGLADEIGKENFFASVHECIAASNAKKAPPAKAS